MQLSHDIVVGILGQVFNCCGDGSWLEGLVAGWARLLFRMARDLFSVAYAQAAQMFDFRMQFVSVHVSLRRCWGQVAPVVGWRSLGIAWRTYHDAQSHYVCHSGLYRCALIVGRPRLCADVGRLQCLRGQVAC